MKIHYAFLVLGVVVASLGRADAAGFNDGICPQATQYVLAVGRVKSTDPPQQRYDVAQAAANAYEQCSKEKLSNGAREPQHYADTRGAQFAVVATRALIEMNRLPEARAELQRWRPYVQQVVDWIAETTVFASGDVNGSESTTSGNHRPSLYKSAAKEIVAAIDEELAQIDRLNRDTGRPQAQQSPGPGGTH